MKTYKTLTILLTAVFAISACKNKGFDKQQAEQQATTQNAPVDTAKGVADDPRIEKGRRLFEENCTSCHMVHKAIIGPALAGVTKRREMGWLLKFTKNAGAMISSGDPIAKKLAEEYNPSIMTEFAFMTDEQIENIYKYIEYIENNTNY